MAVILATTLRIGRAPKESKVIEEGTPYESLTKKEKELAKELGLLKQVPDKQPELEDELEEADADEDEDEDEETEAEDSEAESE